MADNQLEPAIQQGHIEGEALTGFMALLGLSLEPYYSVECPLGKPY